MADYTIVIGGSQSASVGIPSGVPSYMLILGRGAPAGDAHPQVGAPVGSEYVDCTSGQSYVRNNGDDGEDADWTKYRPVESVLLVAEEPEPKPKRRRRKKKEVGDA